MYIYSNNEFDTRSISMIGLSAKEAGSIGRFGTGLKYSIAYFMRTDTPFTLTVDGEPIRFEKRQADFRGKKFEAIYMNGVELPFTTNYAQNWELWQIYRELVSNAYDEGGDVSATPVEARVVFHVPAFDEIEHSNVFLDKKREPQFQSRDLELYEGRRSHFYYRGIRAGNMPQPFPYTINWKEGHLSENRELNVSYSARIDVTRDIITDNMDASIREALAALPDMHSPYFGAVSTREINPHPEFISMARTGRLGHAAAKWLAEYEQSQTVYTPAALGRFEEKLLDEALLVVREVYPDALRSDVNVVRSLSHKAHGAYDPDNQKIYLSLSAFQLGGVSDVAATLIEEFMHYNEGCFDETREMQELLLRKLTYFVQRSMK